MAAPATSSAASTTSSKTSSTNGKTHEEVLAGFQNLRAEQRQLANKISELEMDLNEHKIVVETLQGVEPERRCFRMVGGVLMERKVADTLPALQDNCTRLKQALETLQSQLTRKGQEIQDYMEQHDVKIQKTAPPTAAPPASTKSNVLVTG